MNLARNLLDHRHDITAYDLEPNLIKESKDYGSIPTYELKGGNTIQ